MMRHVEAENPERRRAWRLSAITASAQRDFGQPIGGTAGMALSEGPLRMSYDGVPQHGSGDTATRRWLMCEPRPSLNDGRGLF